jgi:hypothetical protein
VNESKLPHDGAAPAHSASKAYVPDATPVRRQPGAAKKKASVGDRPAADQTTEGPADLRADTLSAESVAMYRARLARGYYGTPAVMHALAERLLESGDL